MLIEKKYKLFIEYFLEHQPNAETELKYENTFQLIIAVILSAQCTDKRVNLITPDLFKRFPDPESLAKANIDEVFEYIKSCTYPNNKSKHLINMAKTLLEKFHGEIPNNVEDLMLLPGVGRKTANVVASVAYQIPAMPVDTHVFRVAARLGLSKNAKTPIQTENQLVQNIPSHLLPLAHHWLILHGRYVCIARKPKCEECKLKNICDHFRKVDEISDNFAF